MVRARISSLFSLLGAFGLASCAGNAVVPKAVPALGAAVAPTPAFRSGSTAAPDKPPVAAAPGAFSTGKVEFRGFTPEALADFRVIPEEGTDLVVPDNGTYPNVDGFWWRPSRQWFKIPNHCAVVVISAPEPDQPSAFTETHDCGNLGAALQKLRGLPDHAGFFPDAGATGHGTDYPFPP